MKMRSVPGLRRGVAGASARRVVRGFTLIELVVVLALVGLVTLLALPNLQGLYESVTRKTEQGRILNQIAGLGWEAMLRRRAYAVYGTGESPANSGGRSAAAGFETYALDVPEGWELMLDRPLLVRANGVCLGASLTLVHQGRTTARLLLEAPYCRVDGDA